MRTLRRDVVSLRDLGIPVEAERGRGGGYRLRPGYRMPPLMLTTAEATTVALGLIGARHDGLDAGSALAKIRRVLPGGVRAQVEALEQTLAFTRPGRAAAPPGGESLLALADATRRGRRVRARYTAPAGAQPAREPPPSGPGAQAGGGYGPPPAPARAAARALRADRFGAVRLGGPGRPPPAGFDPVAFVSRTLARVPWAHAVEVVLHEPAERARERFPPTLAELEPAGERTVLRMRAESLDWVAGLLAGAGCGFEVRAPEGLRGSVRALAERLQAGAGKAPRKRSASAASPST